MSKRVKKRCQRQDEGDIEQTRQATILSRLVYLSLLWLLDRGVRKVTYWVLPVIDRPLLVNGAVPG